MKNCEKCGRILEDNEVCACEATLETPQPTIEVKSKNDSWKSILTAIVYPLICCAIGVILNLTQGYSLIGLILPFLCSSIAAVCVILGGFWFLLIPLPYIYVWKAGRIDKPLTTGKKVIYGILAVVCAVGAILTGLL